LSVLYTHISPDLRPDRVPLYPDPATAAGVSGGRRPIFPVAVHFEARSRRVVPIAAHRGSPDPDWTAPAEEHADGSITVRGPIPDWLYPAG
jgi:hypothetical protein